MSLIHLEKSVLTFHLKEILEDGHGNHPLTWLSLGLLILGPKLLSSSSKIQPATIKKTQRPPETRSRATPISLTQWVAEARQRELETQLYTILESQNTHLLESSPQTTRSHPLKRV
ncbi:MAG: hypothetical protein MUF49_18455 [Oculatellaceae cyanobacterium Prado106]|jgi:hypothetical protein|nr:hypothetical protein [Oculatellaceae cyanobacterium Prado106]